MSMKSLNLSWHIKAPVEKVWKALVNASEIDEWGGGPCEMDSEVGTEFELWGGDIHGRNLEVVENEKLVQEWFGGDWNEPSTVTIAITPERDGTSVTLRQENIPDSELENIVSSWKENYFGPIKEYLEGG